MKPRFLLWVASLSWAGVVWAQAALPEHRVAKPAAPAMPAGLMAQSKPVPHPAPLLEKPAALPAPARPAMPGHARPDHWDNAVARPAPVPAAPLVKPAAPAKPAVPARPAQPAAVN